MRNKFRIGRGITIGLILLGMVLITLSATVFGETAAQQPLMYVSLALIILALIVVFLLCRCPACGQVIFKNLVGAKTCPYCYRPLWPRQKSDRPLSKNPKHTKKH